MGKTAAQGYSQFVYTGPSRVQFGAYFGDLSQTLYFKARLLFDLILDLMLF